MGTPLITPQQALIVATALLYNEALVEKAEMEAAHARDELARVQTGGDFRRERDKKLRLT